MVTDPEDEATQRERMMAYWEEIGQAAANQREKRRVIPEYPPPCDGPWDCEPV